MVDPTQSDPLNQLSGFSLLEISSVTQDDWSDYAGFGGNEVAGGWAKKGASKLTSYGAAAVGAAVGGAIGGGVGAAIGAAVAWAVEQIADWLIDKIAGDDDNDGNGDNGDNSDDGDGDIGVDEDEEEDEDDDDEIFKDPWWYKDPDDDDDDDDASSHPASNSPDGDDGEWNQVHYLNFLWQQQVMTEQALSDIESGKPYQEEGDDNHLQTEIWLMQNVTGQEEDEDAMADQLESLLSPRLASGVCTDCNRTYHEIEDPPRHNLAHGSIPVMNVSVNSPATISTGYITSLVVQATVVETRPSTSILEEAFDDPRASGWDLGWGWEPQALSEAGSAIVGTSDDRWGNFAWGHHLTHGENSTLVCDILLDYGQIQIIYRQETGGPQRYFVWFNRDEMGLTRQVGPEEFVGLAYAPVGLTEDAWHNVAIISDSGTLRVAVDGRVLLTAVDPDPLAPGPIAFETWPHSRAAVNGLAVLDFGTGADLHARLPFTTGFEGGNLRGWTVDGEAFANQPTDGDNSSARGREPSNHEGEWWIGGYEDYQGELGQVAGSIQGDELTGTLTSAPFVIAGSSLSFLIGGGNHPIDDPAGATAVVLLIDGDVVLSATGANTDTMERVEWDVSAYAGQEAMIQVIDQNTGPWGHINCDDFRL